MALPDPLVDGQSVRDELIESTINDDDDFVSIYTYVFGSSPTSGDSIADFAGLGIPELSNLTATGGYGEIDVSFDVDTIGGDNTQIVAQYWDNSQTELPFSFETQEFGPEISSSGTYNKTITLNVQNGVDYDVRITGVNVWNNSKDYPSPNEIILGYNFTNTDSASPESPVLDDPSLVGETVEYSGSNIYVNFDYNDQEDDFVAEYRLNGGSPQTTSVDCENSNVGGSGNPKEVIFNMTGQLPFGQTVEVRVQAQSSTIQNSNYSSWVTATQTSIPSCPL